MNTTKLELKKHYNYLIIGADAAGNSALGQIRRNDKTSTIAIIEKGEIISYGACGLPYAINEQVKSFDNLIHFTAEGFGAKNNAEIHTSQEAIQVDSETNTVTVRNVKEGGEKKVSYDKLLIGTGASAIRLPFIDYSGERVFELKTIPDGRAIQAFIKEKQAKNVAIIGSGYIGMECAEIFREMELQVDIYEALDRPVPKMPAIIAGGVKPLLEKHGIQFYANTRVKKVEETTSQIKVQSEQGEKSYDFILSAVGVQPATEFLKNSGIEMDRGAVIVDRYGRTNKENVWAAGDCAQVYHKILAKNTYLPLGHTANKQGRIAGMNMSGKQIEFQGIVGTVVFKFFDIALAQTGLSLEQAREAGYDAVTATALRPSKAGYYPGSGKAKVELVIDKVSERILGAALVGPLDSYGIIDAAAVMVYSGMTATEAGWFDFAYAPPFAPVWNALISAAGKF